MPRPLSKVAPDWWDYTTLDNAILEDAARLKEKDLLQLSRPGFSVHFYETLEDFYLAEALEYVDAWRQSTADNPAGVCGPCNTWRIPLMKGLPLNGMMYFANPSDAGRPEITAAAIGVCPGLQRASTYSASAGCCSGVTSTSM